MRGNEAIVRNRVKIYSTCGNAAAVLAVQQSHGSFAAYLWGFVDGKPVINQMVSMSQSPASTPLSDQMLKDMKRHGFKFVGSTIVDAFIQGIGMVDDHIAGCWRRADSAT